MTDLARESQENQGSVRVPTESTQIKIQEFLIDKNRLNNGDSEMSPQTDRLEEVSIKVEI